MEKLDIVTGRQESDDYPYGGLRCHISFDIEFTPKKGFRSVTQTTNPKNGRVNKPKKSTYSDFAVLYRDEKGHIHSKRFDLRGYEDIAQVIEFLTIHEIEFTEEQSQHLWACAITCLRANARYTRWNEGLEVARIWETLRVAAMLENFKNHASFNAIRDVGFDLAAIRALCA